MQFDTPDNILRHPANDFVRDFIGQNRLIQDRPNDKTVESVMIKPITIQAEATLNDAVHIMRQKRVDTIFVVDRDNHLLGFLDIEDINQGIRGHKVYEIPCNNIFIPFKLILSYKILYVRF